jgi:hypothetical protein
MANEDDQFSKKAVENSSKLTQDARTIKEEYKDLLGIKSKLNEYDKEAINLADKVQQSAKQNVVELGRTGDLNKEILKDRKLLLDLDRELLISTKNLGTDQQSQAKKLAENNIQRLFVLDQIENIQKELLDLDEIQQYLAVKELSNLSDQLSILENQTSQLIKQTDSDVQRLALAIQTREQQEKNIKAKKVESEVQDQINEKLGIAGNSLKLFNSFLGEAGKGFKFDKVSKDMEAFADEAVRSNKEVSRLQVLGVGVKSAFGNLKNNLTDPVVLIGAMVKGFQDLDKANKEFRQLTGQNVGAFETINTSLISGADYIKSSVKLSKELGVNVRAAFSKETLTEAAELTELMGLGAKETARLATLSKVTGTELKNTATSIETGFQSFVKTNKTAINFGDVMNDVGTASSALSLSLGSDAGKIANAAMEARKLGINLQQAEQIAESLLNFESSIESELEAELLTGKDINLEKARSAALNNDIATLSKEIASNSSINQSFSTGNRIQQEAIAKSLGMSREAMANMIYQQKIQNGLSTEQAAKAADISLEEAKRQTATEQINKAVEKLTQLLGLVLYPINLILSNSVALGLVFSTIAIATLPMLLKGVTSFVGGLKEGLSVAKDLGKKLLGMSPTKDIADKAGDSTGKAADKTKGIAGKSGDDVKNFLKGLASGLKAMSDGKVLKGALNLIPAAIGLTLMTAALPAILVLSIPGIGKSFQANMTGIAKGLSALGKALPDILLGSLALAAIGAAMIPLTYALSLLSPLVEAFGKVILSTFQGISTLVKSVAESFVLLMDSLSLEKIGNLLLLGPALLSASIGLGAFALALGAASVSSFLGGGIIDQIVTLAEMSSPLQTTASALTQLAAGLLGVAIALNQIDTDKLESLNDFAEVNPLTSVGNAISGAIGSIFGNSGEKQTSPELTEIRNILSQILKKETHIYLDTTKVGTGFSMASSKLQ